MAARPPSSSARSSSFRAAAAPQPNVQVASRRSAGHRPRRARRAGLGGRPRPPRSRRRLAPPSRPPAGAEQQVAVAPQTGDAGAARAAAAAPRRGRGSGFRWPVRGRVISGFGKKPDGERNDGINLAVPEGTAVKAAEDGTVIYAGNELKSYGNLVLIRHANGWVSAYAHNSELQVKRGEQVQRGQIVALSGMSGGVTTPQVHFELRKDATPVDPLQHLTRELESPAPSELSSSPGKTRHVHVATGCAVTRNAMREGSSATRQRIASGLAMSRIHGMRGSVRDDGA